MKSFAQNFLYIVLSVFYFCRKLKEQRFLANHELHNNEHGKLSMVHRHPLPHERKILISPECYEFSQPNFNLLIKFS